MGKGQSRSIRCRSLSGQCSPMPSLLHFTSHPRSLIRVEGQSLFLNRMPVVIPRCFLFAPGHRGSDSPPPFIVFLSPIDPQSGEDSAVARSRERWPMSAVHSRIMIVVALRLSSPLCVWPAAIAIDLNFNHLLAMANLPLLLKSIAFQFLCLCWCLALHMVGVAPM